MGIILQPGLGDNGTSLWLLFGRRGAVGTLWILGFYGHKRAASIKGLLMAFTKGVGYCAREGCSQMSAVVARRVILGACWLLLDQVMASTPINQCHVLVTCNTHGAVLESLDITQTLTGESVEPSPADRAKPMGSSAQLIRVMTSYL